MFTVMTDVQNNGRKCWLQNMESYLQQACEAEANLDYVQAAHLFDLALLCEARVRPDVTNPNAYVHSTTPVYVWFGCRGPISTDELIAK